MTISKKKAAELLDFINTKGQESKEPGEYYVSNKTLQKMGIQQWDLQDEKFHKGHHHLEGAKDIIIHSIDKLELQESLGNSFLLGLGKGRER